MRFIYIIFPSLLALFLFFYLDTFRLVSPRKIICVIIFGFISALFSLLINNFLLNFIAFDLYSQWVAPWIEEILKVFIIFILFRKNQIGFLTDAILISFAIGFGFALTENLLYAIQFDFDNDFVWFIRGVGTSFLHSGTVLIFSLLFYFFKENKRKTYFGFIVPYLLAVSIHIFFNNEMIDVVVKSFLQLIFIPIIVYLAYHFSEDYLIRWIEEDFTNDVDFLKMVRSGKFTQTKTGQYLRSLSKHYSPYDMADIFCYLVIYTELGIAAKGLLLMKEMDVKADIDPSVFDKIKELKKLESSLGKSTILTLKPLISDYSRKKWQTLFIRSN